MRIAQKHILKEGTQYATMIKGSIPVALDHNAKGEFYMIYHVDKYRKAVEDREFLITEVGDVIHTKHILNYIDSTNRKGQIYLLFELI